MGWLPEAISRLGVCFAFDLSVKVIDGLVNSKGLPAGLGVCVCLDISVIRALTLLSRGVWTVGVKVWWTWCMYSGCKTKHLSCLDFTVKYDTLVHVGH